ncbi:MAG: hypothetical protein EOP48_14350 [Sphingobacteriales bacterium]|nr:MAG: hypothetical protein EOP48_14350 [Sphingobacteriales bacterium]
MIQFRWYWSLMEEDHKKYIKSLRSKNYRNTKPFEISIHDKRVTIIDEYRRDLKYNQYLHIDLFCLDCEFPEYRNSNHHIYDDGWLKARCSRCASGNLEITGAICKIKTKPAAAD